MTGFFESMIHRLSEGRSGVYETSRGQEVYRHVERRGARAALEALIRSGRHSARKLMRARILLKADASEAGDAWSDSQIRCGICTPAR